MADLQDPRIPESNRSEAEPDEDGRQDGASGQETGSSGEDAQPPRRLDPLLLQSQARSLRKRSGGSIRGADSFEAPVWKKVLTLLVLLVVLGSVIYLLTFPQSRRQMAAQIGGAVDGVQGLREDRILRLPPPVRDQVVRDDSEMPTVIFRSGSSQAEAADDGKKKILFLNTFPEDSQQQNQAAVQKAAPPVKTEGAQAAYDLLLQRSEAARKVAEGEAEGWTFQEWKPVQNNPPRFFISLLAADAEGNLQQLIWEVDTDQGSAVARSQLARELVRQLDN